MRYIHRHTHAHMPIKTQICTQTGIQIYTGAQKDTGTHIQILIGLETHTKTHRYAHRHTPTHTDIHP